MPRKATLQYNLKILFPEVAKDWHPNKNGELRPNQLTPGARNKVWWRCKEGHEWEAKVSDRRRGSGCPFCSGLRTLPGKSLARKNTLLSKEWHPKKNTLTPRDVTPVSGKKVWWLCPNGHEWEATIANGLWNWLPLLRW